MKPVRKAVLPVGGLGTRFLPASKALPKEMFPIVDKPVIQYAVEEALASGIEEIIFVTGRGKSAIEDHFDHSFELDQILKERKRTADLAKLQSLLPTEGQFSYTRQQIPLGLGHAIWCARGLVGDEPFAVLLADDLILSDSPCLGKMIEVRNEKGGNVLAIMPVPQNQCNKYGIIDPANSNEKIVDIVGVVEKPAVNKAPSDLAIVGRYILEPSIFSYLDLQRKGAGGEIQLTDAIAEMIGKVPTSGYRFVGKRFDCGSKAGYVLANLAVASQHPDTRNEISASKAFLQKTLEHLE